MWRRTVGLLLILTACVVWGRDRFPQNPFRYPDWQDTVVDIPFFASQPVTVRCLTPQSTQYLIAVASPDLPPAATGNGLRIAPGFSCEISGGESGGGKTSPFWRPYYSSSAGMYLLKSFAAQAGHTYTVTVTATRRGPNRQRYQTRLRILPDPNHDYRPMIEATAAFCAGGIVAVIGLLLTFWGGSRIPMRNWRLTKQS